MRATMPRLFAVRMVGACLAMTMLHACQHYGQAADVPDEAAMAEVWVERDADPARFAAAERQCLALGGRLQQAGRMGRYACYAQFSDGGASCSDDADCMGECRAVGEAPTGQKAKGQCTDSNNPFGCYASVENGIVGPTICAD